MCCPKRATGRFNKHEGREGDKGRKNARNWHILQLSSQSFLESFWFFGPVLVITLPPRIMEVENVGNPMTQQQFVLKNT